MKEIKKGDWVKVSGEGNEAFKVEFVNKGSVGLVNGLTEPLHKVSKLDLTKFEVVPHTIYYWSIKT
ncbi:MAG: hypothetical protein DRP84_10030 [Spirochaetes bacterium]|nr:MAG: hypothetical protein DRP84_10030 [Spirochaetota bacterium]